MAGNEQGAVPTVHCDEVIEFVMDLLAKGMRKGEIKNAIREALEPNPPHHRTIETVITEAKRRIRENTGRSKDEHLSEGLEFYRSLLRSDHVSPSAKINARTRIDQLLGLGPTFKDDDDPEERARKAREFLAQTNNEVTTNDDECPTEES